jgi:hypothetical protein
MGRALVIHKKKDGTVTLEGKAPDELTISTRLIGSGAEEGHIDTTVTYHFADGDVEYRVVEAQLGDPENPNSPVTSYRLARVRSKAAAKTTKKKG